MAISNNTQSVLAAQLYVRQFVLLDEEGFKKTLSADVESFHASMKAGFQTDPLDSRGYDVVTKIYHDNFFAITSNFDLSKVSYEGFGPHAKIVCKIDEDKIRKDDYLDKFVQTRYHMVCKIQLDFETDSKGTLKKNAEGNLIISKIWERTSKDFISLKILDE